MKALSVSLLVLTSLAAAPVRAHDVWVEPVTVVALDAPVWVAPGVYVSQFSNVQRHHPYVGCCLPSAEVWPTLRPRPSSAGVRIGNPYFRRYRAAIEPPVDHLHYPDGRAIERFGSPAIR